MTERFDDARSLPAVHAVLARPGIVQLIARHGRAAVVQAVREALARARDEIAQGRTAVVSEREIEDRARALGVGSLRPVLNATGIVIHTNLGRAPLAAEAIAAMTRIAEGYSTLEYDLEAGKRGHRDGHVVEVLRALTGAEDALVVNNNAGAVLLALNALSPGREAIVSRGEAVEIGGKFRIPDVVLRSGARLVEVGTTNRTHLADYEGAIGAETALLLKVHRSNFEIVGFTSEVELRDLVGLARARGVRCVHDAGSGCLEPIAALAGEEHVGAQIAAGCDVVTFSGDKLVGGPQAGIAVGRHEAIAAMRGSPLYRALRPDKLTLAALLATLVLWRDAPDRIPVVRMLRATPAELEQRCRALASALGSAAPVEVVATTGHLGGGAAPSTALQSRALRIAGRDAEAFAQALRDAEPPVIARIEDGAVLIDPRAVPAALDEALVAALRSALS